MRERLLDNDDLHKIVVISLFGGIALILEALWLMPS
jgi:hypothetical protein